MRSSMKKYVEKSINQEKFIKDFFDENKNEFIGKAYEKCIEDINHDKYQKTIDAQYNLSLPNKNATTEIIIHYTKRNYHCTCAKHKPKEKIVFLFGAKHNNGHMFGICINCLLKLSLILLKYYKYGELYEYDKSDPIRLERSLTKSECYACRSKDKECYRLKLHNHNLFLCKNCVDKFSESILSSPTVKNVFHPIYLEFENCRKNRK